MELKYQKEIESFNSDLTDFSETNLESFRWVFEDINDKRNFEPIYINDPKRIQDNFLGFALSFFLSKESGTRRLRELTTNKEHLYKKLGTHISKGQLIETDGLASKADEIKHFDFFLYKDVDLKSKFTIIESVK